MAARDIDIVVTSPTGHTDLVVEVSSTSQLELATLQVREYMARVGAAVGLVVARERIVILRETYRGKPSIQVVGEYPLTLARGVRVDSKRLDLEDQVQRWLEQLAATAEAAEEPLMSALREHVLPVIAGGTVRAARERMRLVP